MNPGLKQVALRLHGLHPMDKRWLLKQLAANQCKQVKQYLKEMQSRKWKFEEVLAAEVQKNISVPATNIEARHSSEEIAFLQNLDGEQIFQKLEPEPDWLVSIILASEDWSWTQGVLKRMDSVRAQRVCLLAQTVESINNLKLSASVMTEFFKLFLSAESKKPVSLSRFEALVSEIEQQPTAAIGKAL